MEAKIAQKDDLFVVSLSGILDYENVMKFRSACENHLQNKDVVFNLQGLNFVGSSGLSVFFDTLFCLYRVNRNRMKLCGVKSEYRKMIELSNIRTIEIYENEQWAEYAHQGYDVLPSNINVIKKYIDNDLPSFLEDQSEEG